MDASKKRRCRFGLRALLVAVAICAVGSQVYVGDHSELATRVGALKPGMTKAEVQIALGMKPYTQVAVYAGNRHIRETYLEEKRNGDKVWAIVEYSMAGILQSFAVAENPMPDP